MYVTSIINTVDEDDLIAHIKKKLRVETLVAIIINFEENDIRVMMIWLAHLMLGVHTVMHQ